MRLEAKPMAVISEMGSGRKPWTMGRGHNHTWEEDGDRKLGQKGSWFAQKKERVICPQLGPQAIDKEDR